MLSISYPTLAVTILALSPSLTDGRRIYKRDCVFTWPATDEDTCGTMSRDWLLDESVFKAMNPGIDCSKLVPGQEYCVTWDGAISIPPIVTSTSPPTSTKPSSTTLVTTTRSSSAPSGPALPSPVQSGVPSDCQKWYLVESDDTCQGIVDTYKTFTLAQFYLWNPAVGTTCQSLQADVFVCVGVLGAPTGTPTAIPTRTTTTTTTTKPSPPATPRPCRWNSSKGQYDCPGVWPPAPGPTQEGVPYDCMKWVIQKDGIYCAEMAKAAGITLARFYTLNPGVGTSCGGLWLGYAYCVATE